MSMTDDYPKALHALAAHRARRMPLSARGTAVEQIAFIAKAICTEHFPSKCCDKFKRNILNNVCCALGGVEPPLRYETRLATVAPRNKSQFQHQVRS